MAKKMTLSDKNLACFSKAILSGGVSSKPEKKQYPRSG